MPKQTRSNHPDIRPLACNVTVARSMVSAGSKAYLLQWGHDSVRILVRSRSGRWIERWERRNNIDNLRNVTVPAQRSEYPKLKAYYPPEGINVSGSVPQKIPESLFADIPDWTR